MGEGREHPIAWIWQNGGTLIQQFFQLNFRCARLPLNFAATLPPHYSPRRTLTNGGASSVRAEAGGCPGRLYCAGLDE